MVTFMLLNKELQQWEEVLSALHKGYLDTTPLVDYLIDECGWTGVAPKTIRNRINEEKTESEKLNQFLELYQDKESNKKLAKQKYPIGWQPHAEYDPKSNKGTLVSRGTQDQEPEFATLLLEWGFDPKEYEIVGNLQVRTWDMNMGGGETQQAWYYKADIRKKST